MRKAEGKKNLKADFQILRGGSDIKGNRFPAMPESGDQNKKEMERVAGKFFRGAAALLLSLILFSGTAFADVNLESTFIDFLNLFDPNSVTCDIEVNPACQNFGIAQIYDGLDSNYRQNVSLYQKQYICVAGDVKSVSTDGSKVEVSDPEVPTRVLTGRTDNEQLKARNKQLKNGERVRMLGKAAVSNLFGKKTVTMEITWIEPTTRKESLSSTVFSFGSGRSFDTAASARRMLASGEICFLIPSTWEAVEEEISGVGMNGWVYRLNEIATDFKTRPEQVYVFYFDNESGLRDSTDMDRDEMEIEQAIIQNIMDKNLDKSRSIRQENGPKFTYYRGNYKDSASRYNNVEFICSALGKKGIFCVMYVYDTSDHQEDIIYMLRTLEKKE